VARRTDDKRVVLAYSGGLDTSVVTRWLTERGWEVICMTADMGYLEEDEELESRAYAAGAVGFEMLDLRDDFARAFCFPALMAGAVYEGRYPLATALARPLIAKALVDVARRHNATAVAHGCTGKGNDQVRFDVSVQALAPDLRILAPVREWELTTRESEIVYAQAHSIPITVSVDKQYSTDENLWGRSIEAGPLEDPWTEPPDNVWEWTVNPEQAPNEPTYIEIGFEHGRPVSLDGEDIDPVTLISRVHDVAGANGVGRIDMVEDRLVGIKSRGVYEAPGMELLGTCYAYLQQLILDRRARAVFDQLSAQLARQVYEGYWFDLASSAMRRAVDTFTSLTTGTIVVDVYRGHVAYASAHDVPHSLYSDASSMEGVGDFDHRDSEGFLGVLGVSARALSTQGHIDSD